MDNYCAFSNNHKCVLWNDYDITRYELAEANNLCHGNWIEIQRKERYISLLQELLLENGVEYPNEFDT